MIIIANNLILAAWKHSHSSNKTLLCCFFLYLCTTGPDSAHPLVTNMTFWIRYVRNCEALKILRNLNTAVWFPYRPHTLVWLNVSQTVAFLKWNARCIYEQRERNKESGAVLAEVHLPLVEFMTTWLGVLCPYGLAHQYKLSWCPVDIQMVLHTVTTVYRSCQPVSVQWTTMNGTQP